VAVLLQKLSCKGFVATSLGVRERAEEVVGNVHHIVALEVSFHDIGDRWVIIAVDCMTIGKIQNQTSLLEVIHANQNRYQHVIRKSFAVVLHGVLQNIELKTS
jgi:hypothetical protein